MTTPVKPTPCAIAVSCLPLVLVLITLGVATRRWWGINQAVTIYDLEDNRRLAIQMFIDNLESVGNMSLALIGVLWAFVVYKDAAIEIKTLPRWLLFLGANAALLASYGAYIIGQEYIVAYLFEYKTISLSSPRIAFWFQIQRCMFVQGIVYIGTTIWSAYKKES